MERAAVFTTCPVCGGTRLNEAARSSKIDGLSIADVCEMQVTDAAEWLRGIDDKGVAPLVANLLHLFDSFVEIGLGYLSLDRPSGTLSGGESQRTKMVRHIGSALTDVTYVFDEPTIGLHPHDIQRMNDLLLRLRDKGNTVLVVEHKPEAIEIADHVIDLGPGAGIAGGEAVFEGTVDGLRASGIYDRATPGRPGQAEAVGAGIDGSLEVRGASTHNLRDLGCRRPARCAGGRHRCGRVGEAALIRPIHIWSGRRRVHRSGCHPRLAAEQPGDLHGTARSHPGGVRQGQRGEARVVQRQLRGACPSCNGAGVIYTDLAMMAGVATICEECEGKRYQASVLEYHLGGRDISEVLAMSVTEAEAFFRAGAARTPAAHAILGRLADVGLGYISLGQPLTTLSGGERQRLKLRLPRWPRRAASTSSMSRPVASTSRTSSSSSVCSTGSSIPAGPSSSSSITRRSWRTPTDDRPRSGRRPRWRPHRVRGHARPAVRGPLDAHGSAPRGLRRPDRHRCRSAGWAPTRAGGTRRR